ncbi:MAG: ATP-binding protein [Candidatus Odinarchaeota archaeon]|nr:ATP-binding protein [Candidatus Odinarchaeota archaeon]
MFEERPILGFVLDNATPNLFYVALRRDIANFSSEKHPGEEGAYALMKHPTESKYVVLLQIIEVVSKNKLFSEQSSTFPFLISGKIGTLSDSEYIIAKVTSLGYMSKNGLTPLRFPPRPRQKIYPAYDRDLFEFFKMDLPWMLHIGKIQNTNVNIYLDAYKLITQHIGILGMTGSGKSYFTSVLVEELVSNNILGAEYSELERVVKKVTKGPWTVNLLVKILTETFKLTSVQKLQVFELLKRVKGTESTLTVEDVMDLLFYPVPVIIIDAHGEYSTLKWPNYINVNILDPTDLQWLLNSDNSLENFSLNKIITKLQNKLGNLLTTHERKWIVQAILELRKAKVPTTLDAIIRRILEMGGPRPETKERLVLLLETVFRREKSKHSHGNIDDLITPGTLTIIDMSSLQSVEKQQELVGALANELFRLGVQRKFYENFAVFLIIEEAHRYAPETNLKIGNPKLSKAPLTVIATQGRKFRIGLGLVSQRPALIGKSILSQANTLAIFRLLSQADIDQVKDTFGRFPLLDKLTQLPTGNCILLGLASPVPFPTIVDVKERKTKTASEKANLIDIIGRMKRRSSERIRLPIPA